MKGYLISNATAKAALRLRGCTHLDRVAQIIAEVSRLSGVAEADILSRKRRAEIVSARNLVAAECRRLGMSYSAIGRALGRDHSTVQQGLRAAAHRGEIAEVPA